MNKLLLGASAYLGIVNVGAFGIFAYDKHQATSKGWRVRERDLCLSALLGGWIGGMLAMQMFRHKTVKQEFRQKYFTAVGANAAILAGVGVASPKLRNVVMTNIGRDTFGASVKSKIFEAANQAAKKQISRRSRQR